jgi:hypothetical protein
MGLEQLLQVFPANSNLNPLVLLQKYGWYIVFTLVAAILVEKHLLGPYLYTKKREQSWQDATRPERVSLLTTDMKQVRQRQQEQAAVRNQEAAVAAKAKKLARQGTPQETR